VGDEVTGSRSNSEFEKYLIIWIGKSWPPGEKDVLMESHRADIIEKILKLLRRESRDLAGPV